MAERIYTINLRRYNSKLARWEKSKRSIAIVKEFLKRHMKTEEIKLDKSITEEIWKKGSQKPPGKIRIKVTETEEGEKDEKRTVVKAELLGIVHEEQKETRKEEKVEDKKQETPKVEEKPKEEKK